MAHSVQTKVLSVLVALAVAIGGGGWLWQLQQTRALPDGIVSGNGRLEAVQVEVATTFPGRVAEVLVRQGDRVDPGQVVARMDTAALLAQRRVAEAQVLAAQRAKATADTVIAQRQGARATAAALVAQRKSDEQLARDQFERATALFERDALPQAELDRARQMFEGARALRSAATSQAREAELSIRVAKAQAGSADASIAAAVATTEQIEQQLSEAELTAPAGGRVQHRLVQPGEVIGAGSTILVLIDLSDVYMTIFLPETSAGKIAIGAPARLVLDAAPEYVLPAEVSYVADEAQFTPKTVETKREREKFVFETKLQLAPEIVAAHASFVKIGMPGVGYVRTDPGHPWTEALAVTPPPAQKAQRP